MKKISTLFLCSCFAILSLQAFAQSTFELRQVIVLNEGPFGGPVSLGSYNPSNGTYFEFDSIDARFATDVLVHNNFIYVAADSLLLKYDAISHQLLQQKGIVGVRELAIWNDKILVSRGESSFLSSYLQVYNTSDLSLAFEIFGLSGDAAEVKVLGDTAYLAVNDFGAIGKLAVIDLNGQVLNREVDLGLDGLNPEAIRVEGNMVYAVSSPNFINTSVTKFNSLTTASQVTVLNTSSGCAASALFNTNVYFQVSSENKLRVFSTMSSIVWDSIDTGHSSYGLGIDTLNARIYSGLTDWSSYGKVKIYDFYGALVDSFDTHISPGTFAFDILNTTGVKENTLVQKIQLSPNPSNGKLNLFSSSEKIENIKVYSVLGQLVYEKQAAEHRSELDLSFLQKGIYFAKIKSESKEQTMKFILQ